MPGSQMSGVSASPCRGALTLSVGQGVGTTDYIGVKATEETGGRPGVGTGLQHSLGGMQRDTVLPKGHTQQLWAGLCQPHAEELPLGSAFVPCRPTPHRNASHRSHT